MKERSIRRLAIKEGKRGSGVGKWVTSDGVEYKRPEGNEKETRVKG